MAIHVSHSFVCLLFVHLLYIFSYLLVENETDDDDVVEEYLLCTGVCIIRATTGDAFYQNIQIQQIRFLQENGLVRGVQVDNHHMSSIQ
jgi:hypothetical protein